MAENITRVLDCKAEYERLVYTVAELEALCQRATPSLTGMPKGGAHLTDDTWAKLIDYKKSCEDRLNEYFKMRIELEEELDRVRNPDIRTALKYKYVDGITIEATALRMHYSTRTIDRYLRIGRKIYAKL